MGFVRDVARYGWIDTETGQFISELMAYTNYSLQAALAQQQAQNVYANQLGQLAGLASNAAYYPSGTANTTNYNPSARIVAPAPVPIDEKTWLRKRVAEVCWRAA